MFGLKKETKPKLTGILAKIFEARQEWVKKYAVNGRCETPWDSCNTLEMDANGRCWLNPGHQRHLNYGGVDEADLQDWLDGKPGTIIKSQEHWDELLFICKANATLIGYEIEFFNLHPIEFLLSPGQVYQPGGPETRKVGKGLPKRLQLPAKKYEAARLTPETIKAIEGHIKWKLMDDFRRQVDMGINPYAVSCYSGMTYDEIYGFFEALDKLGLNTCQGACNTPQVRENFSWWKDLLHHEAQWQLWIEMGLAYQPWVDNKKSLYSTNPNLAPDFD